MIEIKSQPAGKYHSQILENFRASSSDGVCSCVAGAREGEGESQDSTNIKTFNNLVQSRESSQTAAQGGQEVSAANIKKILRFVSPPVLYRGLAVTELVFSALLCLCPSWPGRILRSWSRRQQRSSAPSLVTVTRDVNGEPVDKIYSPDSPNNSIGAVFLFPCLVKS